MTTYVDVHVFLLSELFGENVICYIPGILFYQHKKTEQDTGFSENTEIQTGLPSKLCALLLYVHKLHTSPECCVCGLNEVVPMND